MEKLNITNVCKALIEQELTSDEVKLLMKTLAKVMAKAEDPKENIDAMSSLMFREFAKKNLKVLAVLPKPTIRLLVEQYDDSQKLRIAAQARTRIPLPQCKGMKAKEKKKVQEEFIKKYGYDKPEVQQAMKIIAYGADLHHMNENFYKAAMDVITDAHSVTKWMKSNTGVGPVITGGICAYVDINKAVTAGHILSYAGWTGKEPEKKKGEKVNYNPKLRVLLYKLGCSFQKVCNRENAPFGQLYKMFRQQYAINNFQKKYADEAAKQLIKLQNSKAKSKGLSGSHGTDTISYELAQKGMLNDLQIDKRARRTAVGIFINILHGVMYRDYLHMDPPVPYVKAQLNHAHLWTKDETDAITRGEIPVEQNNILKELKRLNEYAAKIGAPVYEFGKTSRDLEDNGEEENDDED